jgi:hypothetical protein
MIELEPYRSPNSFFNLRRVPNRSSAMIALFVAMGIAWFGIVIFAMSYFDGGAGVFVLFFLSAVLLIAIPVALTFGMQFMVNMRLGKSELRCDKRVIYRGADLSVEFTQPVKSRIMMRGAKIQLVRQEWVKWTQGTDTHTKTHNAIIDEIIFDGEQKHSGDTIWLQAQFQIPSSAMHNFSFERNRMQWFIAVTVDIPAFPDFYDEYALEFPAR